MLLVAPSTARSILGTAAVGIALQFALLWHQCPKCLDPYLAQTAFNKESCQKLQVEIFIKRNSLAVHDLTS